MNSVRYVFVIARLKAPKQPSMRTHFSAVPVTLISFPETTLLLIYNREKSGHWERDLFESSCTCKSIFTFTYPLHVMRRRPLHSAANQLCQPLRCTPRTPVLRYIRNGEVRRPIGGLKLAIWGLFCVRNFLADILGRKILAGTCFRVDKKRIILCQTIVSMMYE